jgi:hypothetical protein
MAELCLSIVVSIRSSRSSGVIHDLASSSIVYRLFVGVEQYFDLPRTLVEAQSFAKLEAGFQYVRLKKIRFVATSAKFLMRRLLLGVPFGLGKRWGRYWGKLTRLTEIGRGRQAGN